MKNIVRFGDVVEKNGKTIRENNFEKKHNIELGTVVQVELNMYSGGLPNELNRHFFEFKTTCRLYVVSHDRDCDGTPLYGLSDLPVKYPEGSRFSREALAYGALAKFNECGFGEARLLPVGKVDNFYNSLQELFGI